MMFSNKIDSFAYYRPHALGYELLPLHKRLAVIMFLACSVVVMGSGYVHVTFPQLFEESIGIMLGPLVLAIILAPLITRKVIFDTHERAVKVYYFGLLCRKRLFADFDQFHATENHLNWRYVGTDIYMKFKKGRIALGRLKETDDMNHLLRETKLIVSATTHPRNQ